MNGLHIVHVLASFEVGGAERVALSLARSQLQRGAKVTVVALSDANPILEEKFQATGAPTKIMQRTMRGVDLFLVGKLKKFFREEGASLIHAHNPLANIYATLAAHQTIIPVIYTKHGDAIDKGFRMWLRRRAARMNHTVVAVSESTADTAMQLREHAGIRPVVIQNGVDCDVFRPNADTRARMRASLGFGDEHFVLGSIARLQPVKRHNIQIDAVEPLLDECLRLAICGDGPLARELKARVANSAKRESIFMLGNRSDVNELLTAFDVFVLTSEREGLPLVILEAMASGLPVIATAVGGIPKVIEHAVNGFLVPKVDAGAFRAELQRVLELPREQLAEVGRTAREHVLGSYSTQAMANAYAQVYRDAISSGRR